MTSTLHASCGVGFRHCCQSNPWTKQTTERTKPSDGGRSVETPPRPKHCSTTRERSSLTPTTSLRVGFLSRATGVYMAHQHVIRLRLEEVVLRLNTAVFSARATRVAVAAAAAEKRGVYHVARRLPSFFFFLHCKTRLRGFKRSKVEDLRVGRGTSTSRCHKRVHCTKCGVIAH